MQNGNSPATGEAHSASDPRELLALCTGLLPVWARHLATSRAQSEVAVAEMLKAFADIGPHINMAERQSQQINDALAQPMCGVTGLVEACEAALAPLMQDSNQSASSLGALQTVLTLVRSTVGALEQIARPFQHETQMVAQQVERMYMGFQYQDRISQMMSLLEGDIADLQGALSGTTGPAPSLTAWMEKLASQYAMAEQHEDHTGVQSAGPSPGQDNETTFF
jgi:hypothetical protein